MKKKKINLTYLPIIIGIAFGICTFFFINKIGLDNLFFDSGLKIIIYLIELYLAIFLQVVIHELGHLTFGILTGYKFLSYRVLNFMIIKRDKKFSIKKMSLTGTSGQCLMAPPNFKNGKMPFILYNLGGVIFNLIFAISGLYLYLFYDYIYLKSFGIIMAIIGLFYAIINGVPLGLSVNNDGYNVLLLLKNKEAVYAFWLQMKINEALLLGTSLKDMNKNWFKIDDNNLNNSMINTIKVYNCNRLLDEKKFEKAYYEMDKLLESDQKIVDIHRNLLILDCIYCEIILKNNDKYLKKYHDNLLQRFISSMKNYPSILRVNYVYSLLIEKNNVKAEKIMNTFNKIRINYPYEVDIKSEEELMEYAKKNRLSN